jgi:flagellar basal body-associated protein FliL
MRRTVVLVVLLVVVAVGGGIYWWQTRDSADGAAAKPTTTTGSAEQRTAPVELSPAAQQVTEKQEQDERARLVAIATELELTTQQSDRLVSLLGEMQNGRRALFADLAARKLPVEQVSQQLRDLREAMHAAFAKEVGDEHAKAIRERMRVAHGGAPQ